MNGAAAALRGYRLQILHAIELLLFDVTMLRLEGIEDIDVLREDHTVEVLIQVKAYQTPLVFSQLSSSGGSTGFFQRLYEQSHVTPEIQGRVVSFGPLGEELSVDLARSENTTGLVEKIERVTVDGAGGSLLARTLFVPRSELDVDRRVSARLQELCPSATPRTSGILIAAWLLRCAEDRAIVTREQLLRQLDLAGHFAAECRAHAEEWYRTIVPIDTAATLGASSPLTQLADEFYQGIGARREHVLADLDAHRPGLIRQISMGFERCNVVILHGASGSGKTTLMHRYAEDYRGHAMRFTVDASSSGDSIPRIALALSAYATAAAIELVLLIDVRPGDRSWTRLLEQLAPLANVRILVAIREEDWLQSQHVTYRVQIHSVEVALSEQEAEQVFDRLQQIRPSPHFLTFREAWAAFGGAGPLLEFVYLATQTIHLRTRLQEQYRRLREELSEKELRFVHLAACGTAYAGRVSLRGLERRCKLNPRSTIRMLERLEREYMLRRDPSGDWLEAVHPLRSQTLCDLAFDVALRPIDQSFKHLVILVDEIDLERLLLESFLRCNNKSIALDFAQRWQWQSWSALAAVLRATIWFEISEHVATNRQLVMSVQAAVPAWRMLLSWRVSPRNNDKNEIIARELRDSLPFPEGVRRRMESIADAIPTLQYKLAKRVLATASAARLEPRSVRDWMSLAECAYWASVLFCSPPRPALGGARHDLVADLPLQVQAGLVSACSGVTPLHWRTAAERFVAHYQIVEIRDNDDGTLFVTFLISGREVRDLSNSGSHALNARAMAILSVLHALVPGRQGYGCEGVGWPRQEAQYHELKKIGLEPFWLEPRWQSRMLPVFIELVRFADYPKDWAAHTESVRAFRREFLTVLRQALHFLEHQAARPAMDREDRAELWQAGKSVLQLPEIPQCARSRWCVPPLDWSQENEEHPRFFAAEYQDYIGRVQSAMATSGALMDKFASPVGDEFDWQAIERCAIAASNDLRALHQNDFVAPYRRWWPEAELSEQAAAEQSSVFDVMCCATLRKQGHAIAPDEAVVRVREGMARVRQRLTLEFADPGITIVSEPVAGEVVSFRLYVGAYEDIDATVARFCDVAWATLREESELLWSVLQTCWSKFEVSVCLADGAVSALELFTAACLIDGRKQFERVLGARHAQEVWARCLVSPVKHEVAQALERHLGDFFVALLSFVDARNSARPSWSQEILGRFCDVVGAEFEVALAGMEASLVALCSEVGDEAQDDIVSLLTLCRQFDGTDLVDHEAPPRWLEFIEGCNELLAAMHRNPTRSSSATYKP